MQTGQTRNNINLSPNNWLSKPLGLALFAFLLLAPLPQKSIALTGSLYEAMVPISNTLPAKSQPELIQEGLKMVLIQLSGSEKVVASAAVKRAMESADGYVTRFSLKEDKDKNRFLRVKFDESRVNELLRRLNAPIFAENRPSATVWLVVARESDNPRWVSNESETELFQQFSSAAKIRAMPLLFPLLDITDTQQVTEKTVWDDDFTALHTASKRYNADVILIGKLSKQESGWHGQWTLMANGKTDTWDNSNENLEHLSQNAMDEFTQRLGRMLQVREREQYRENDREYDRDQYRERGQNYRERGQDSIYGRDPYDIPDPALMTQPSETPPVRWPRSRAEVSRFRLSIAGIKGVEQYTKLQAYLKTLPGVEEVEVSVANPEETLFDVVAKTNRQNFIDAIAQGNVLVANSSTLLPSAQSVNAEQEAINADQEAMAEQTPHAVPIEENGILNYKMAEVF